MDKPLTGKIVLVTGASRGIGRSAALALAKAGAHVIAVARTSGGLEELDDDIRAATGERATLVPLDIANGDELDILGGVIHQRFGRLDVLVHSAGVLGPLTPVSHLEPKHWDRAVAVNLTAVVRLLRAFEPLLRLSESGRGIFLTGAAARHPRAFWGCYSALKAGTEALIQSWADELENTPVRGVIVDPGRVRTAMHAEAWPGWDPNSLPHPDELGPMFVELAVQPNLGLPDRPFTYAAWAAAKKAVLS